MVPLVVGAASAGLSGLLARSLFEQLDTADEIHDQSPVVRHVHDATTGRSAAARPLGLRRVDRAAGRQRLCWFPDPMGAQDCYRAAHADPVLLHLAFPELLDHRQGLGDARPSTALRRRRRAHRTPVAAGRLALFQPARLVAGSAGQRRSPARPGAPPGLVGCGRCASERRGWKGLRGGVHLAIRWSTPTSSARTATATTVLEFTGLPDHPAIGLRRRGQRRAGRRSIRMTRAQFAQRGQGRRGAFEGRTIVLPWWRGLRPPPPPPRPAAPMLPLLHGWTASSTCSSSAPTRPWPSAARTSASTTVGTAGAFARRAGPPWPTAPRTRCRAGQGARRRAGHPRRSAWAARSACSWRAATPTSCAG